MISNGRDQSGACVIETDISMWTSFFKVTSNSSVHSKLESLSRRLQRGLDRTKILYKSPIEASMPKKGSNIFYCLRGR